MRRILVITQYKRTPSFGMGFPNKYKLNSMESFKWLTESNRWKHLVLAICIGLWANSWYCAEYTGVGVASALEYKDLLYGNKWDWLDWLCTVAGATIGYAVRYFILHI